jgi:beta-mannosidase
MILNPLHSGWTFSFDGTEYAAQVPGCIHSDLRRHELIPDPFWGANELAIQWIEERDWAYSLRFRADADLLGHEHVELVCDGLDTLATIVLNGHEVAQTDNMFVGSPFRCESAAAAGRKHAGNPVRMPDALHPRAAKTYEEHQWNDPVGGRTAIRKQQCSFGWDWGPRLATCGIWQPIRLEAWNFDRLETVHITQHHAGGKVRLALRPATSNAGASRYRVTLKRATRLWLRRRNLLFRGSRCAVVVA